MKTTKLFTVIALLGFVSLTTSCKKNYTCTCTTAVGPLSGDVTHSVDNSTYVDAKKTCENYEDQANSNSVGSTVCRL